MHGKTLLLLASLFPLAIQRAAISQDPHLFLSLPEIAHRNAIAIRPCPPHWYSDPYGDFPFWVSPLASERQVPMFHMKACARLAPLNCRSPSSP